MTPQTKEQKQRNEIGRLTKLVADLQAVKSDMANDLRRGRDTMEEAADKLAADSLKSSRRDAEKLLRDELTHREKTREQRKGRSA
jgi:DNA-binding ferritin-like protein